MTTEADRHTRGLENLRTVDAKAGEQHRAKIDLGV